MFKLVLRFFIICILVTLLFGPIVLYIQTAIDSSNDTGNIKLLTAGKFLLLDDLLLHHPQSEWQTILDKIRPSSTYRILVVPIAQLSLSKQQIADLNNNKIVYLQNTLDDDWPSVIYKRIDNSPYAYKHLGSFNTSELAHRLFEWQQIMIIKKLQTLAENRWPEFLNKASQLYGYSISTHDLANLPLSSAKKQQLLNNQWVIYYPNKSNDSTQVLYTPIPHSNKILQIGPMYLPFTGVYKTHILFISVFLIIELIIFIFVVFFARSLDKLKKLADDYGQGSFSSHIKLRKTSNLYPLYNNLLLMGDRIKGLLASHKELTNTIAHELRTPISRMRFSLELLKESKDHNEQVNRITTMEDDINELEDLVSEILTYATLDRISVKFEPQPVKISKLLKLVEDKFRPMVNKNNFVIKVSKEIAKTPILADTKYLLRALQNLLQNANNHAKSTVQISADCNHLGNIQLIIEDDGPGISEEDRARIFEPFVRLPGSNHHQSAGYGLGLAITKKIIALHKWEIAVTDSPMGGACITITTG